MYSGVLRLDLSRIREPEEDGNPTSIVPSPVTVTSEQRHLPWGKESNAEVDDPESGIDACAGDGTDLEDVTEENYEDCVGSDGFVGESLILSAEGTDVRLERSVEFAGEDRDNEEPLAFRKDVDVHEGRSEVGDSRRRIYLRRLRANLRLDRRAPYTPRRTSSRLPARRAG